MKIYLRLVRYIGRYKKYILISVTMSILFSLFSAISVYLTIPLLKTLFLDSTSPVSSQTNVTGVYESIKHFVESYIFSSDKESALLKICILIFIAFLLKNLTGILQSIYMQYVEKGVLRDIRFDLYKKINQLSLRYFTKEKSGSLISRLTNDINAVQSGISAAFSNLIKDPLLIIAFFILSLSISWQMTLTSLVVFPVTVFIVTRLGDSLRRRSSRVQQKLSEIVSHISETIYGAKIIRAFGIENYRNNLFRKENDAHYQLIMKSAKTYEFASPVTEMLTIIAGIIIIWIGGREILIYNNLKPEEFLGFLFILFQLIVPLKNLSSVSNRIQESAAAGERIFEVLDYPIEVKEVPQAVFIDKFNDKIELKNVSFSYDGNKYILKNLNLTIHKSELLAIVGHSGVGKTTVADLIARFYDVTEGKILIDGIDIRNIKLESLRKLIGIVPQETILFNDTIRNNITFGLENVTDEEVINAAKFANAYEFIMETENGFDTIVGERGTRLSGGQKQRIAIARSILRNPQILILDEATSSLDSESETLVQEAFEKLMKNRTSIVIAHRLSTVRNADKIVVLHNQNIIQSGTHEELFHQENGIYRKLCDLQFGE
ncbi:MAG: ABC transporter ATP-binding protein [Ignavibacteria bacterium]